MSASSLSVQQIVDTARQLYIEWRRQFDRYDNELPAMFRQYGVSDYDPDTQTFCCQGETFAVSDYGELYYHPYGVLVDDETPVMPEPERGAIHFVDQITRLVSSCNAAIHYLAEELGWSSVDDTGYEEIFWHPDADHLISVPYWCDDFDEIKFPDWYPHPIEGTSGPQGDYRLVGSTLPCGCSTSPDAGTAAGRCL